MDRQCQKELKSAKTEEESWICLLRVVFGTCLDNMFQGSFEDNATSDASHFLLHSAFEKSFAAADNMRFCFYLHAKGSDKAMEISPVSFQDMGWKPGLGCTVVAHLAIHWPYAISIKSDVAKNNLLSRL